MFKGLQSGVNYKIVETKTPVGYNKADDIIFRIEEDYDNGEIKYLTIYDLDDNILGRTSLNHENYIFSIPCDYYNFDEETGEETISSSLIISTNIVNTTGIKLPSTGSTGAIIVYCISGIAMIVCIASFIVAKKKRNNE